MVRHGETPFNAKSIHQPKEAELSPHGVHQAKKLAERFRSIDIDVILASPLQRAKQTAEIIQAVIKKPIRWTPLLVEVKRPTIIEGMLYDQPEAVAIKQQIHERFHDPTFRHSDEETFFDLRDRALLFLHHVISMKETYILVVSHADFIKVILSVMIFDLSLNQRMALDFYHALRIGNTGLTVCEWTDNRWRLITWNDQSHLG